MTPSAPGGCHCGRWLSSFLQVCFAGRLSATELIPMHMRSGQVREVVGLSFEAVFGVSLGVCIRRRLRTMYSFSYSGIFSALHASIVVCFFSSTNEDSLRSAMLWSDSW